MLFVDSFQIAHVIGTHTSSLRTLKRLTMPKTIPRKMVAASDQGPSHNKRLHGYEVNHVCEWLRSVLLPDLWAVQQENELMAMARGASYE